MDLPGRTVVITGASSGIGAAAAKAIAARGARVVLVARRAAALEEVAATITTNGGHADVFVCDITDPDAVIATGARIRDEVGIPDVLVNNAGAGRWLFVHETPPQELVAMTAAPYFGAFWMTRQFLPGMLRRNSGRIVNITAPAAYVPWAGGTGYVVARWAMRGFHHALRSDLITSKVGCSLVIPGEVTSDYFANNPGTEERLPRVARLYPRATPEDVAEAIIKAIELERRFVTTPWIIRATMLLHRLWPRAVEFPTQRTAIRIMPPASDNPDAAVTSDAESPGI